VAVLAGTFLETGADRLLGPIKDGMGRVVEELPDDLAPIPGVAASLDLDEGRNAFLVQEEVVERPA
jgi:hypothetical protein